MKITFFEAVQQVLTDNSRIKKQQRKIDYLKRKLEKMEKDQDWQWEIKGEGRVVSPNTRTTSKKKLLSLQGEKELDFGLEMGTEISLKEKNLLNQGLNKDSIDFEIELEQPLYPTIESDAEDKYRSLLLRLTREEAKLQQLQNKLVIYCLEDYLELIELKLKRKITKREYELLRPRQEVEQEKEAKKKNLKNKIKTNKAQQLWTKAKNKYQEKLRDFKLNLGLESSDQLVISTTKKIDLKWLTELEQNFLSLDNSEELLKLAVENNQDLLINKLKQQQVKNEQLEQAKSAKPQIDLNADYNISADKWQIALNITHKLFNQQQNKLNQEELESELAALEEKEMQYYQELEGEIRNLVGKIKVAQLQVEEKELRLQEARLDLEQVEEKKEAEESNDFEYQLEKLDLQEAELNLKKKEHQLILNQYELIKLLGGLVI
ncbi:MAG: TolC family protein [Bacillota bacterium]